MVITMDTAGGMAKVTGPVMLQASVIPAGMYIIIEVQV